MPPRVDVNFVRNLGSDDLGETRSRERRDKQYDPARLNRAAAIPHHMRETRMTRHHILCNTYLRSSIPSWLLAQRAAKVGGGGGGVITVPDFSRTDQTSDFRARLERVWLACKRRGHGNARAKVAHITRTRERTNSYVSLLNINLNHRAFRGNRVGHRTLHLVMLRMVA